MYDARYWESAYRDIDEAPTLVIQLQDDLTHSRRREAFWISVVVHLLVVLLIVNSARIAGLVPRQTAVLVNPNALPKDKDLTFLELPPDQQKPPAKAPETNIISDKNRIATSKAPQIDRKELKKILDSSRPGRPGPSGAPQQPAPGAEAQAAPAPSNRSSRRRHRLLQIRISAPSCILRRCRRRTRSLPAQGMWDQQPSRRRARQRSPAAAAVAATTAISVWAWASKAAAYGALDVLSDTMGVDFGPYLARVLHDVKMNWYNLIPESARAPIMKKGNVGIEFAILKDGSVAGMKLVFSSGDVALDRGAWGGITTSNPFPPLPTEFGGQYLALRFKFLYNPDKRICSSLSAFSYDFSR